MSNGATLPVDSALGRKLPWPSCLGRLERTGTRSLEQEYTEAHHGFRRDRYSTDRTVRSEPVDAISEGVRPGMKPQKSIERLDETTGSGAAPGHAGI